MWTPAGAGWRLTIRKNLEQGYFDRLRHLYRAIVAFYSNKSRRNSRRKSFSRRCVNAQTVEACVDAFGNAMLWKPVQPNSVL
jgi:hypothetical protein